MGNLDNQKAEEILKRLVNRIDEEHRTVAALEAKRQGKKIIGVVSPSVPEEVILAAGMFPWRIAGTWQGDVSRANTYRPVKTDLYCTHVLQSLLNGDLDFLDGVVFAYWTDDIRRLWDIWIHLKKPSFAYMLYVPHKDSDPARTEFRRGIGRFITALEEFGNIEISKQDLFDAIEVYNRWRTLLMRIYELRKREIPAIWGWEALGVTTASFVTPRGELNQDLETLVNALEGRRISQAPIWPRLMVCGEDIDDPARLKLIEDLEAVVAMDDLDTGSRYFWNTTEANGDPIHALAKRYLACPSSPRNYEWNKYVDQVIEWVRDFNIDGILNLPGMYNYWRQTITPYLVDRLTESGVPIMTFSTEYRVKSMAQLQTRIQAFIETLGARRRT